MIAITADRKRKMRADALSRQRLSGKRLPLLLAICGLLGLYASFVLTVDKFNLAANPHLQLDCNINPIISCGSVMKTPEASLFGFANSLIGIPAFAVVLFLGVTALFGTMYKKWIWLGLQAGSFLGIVLTHWLFYQSVFNIHALCPYCMLVWVVTMLIFWYTTVHNLEKGYLADIPGRISSFCQRHHLDILLCWTLVLVAIIVNHFWYFIRTLLPA